MRCPDCKSEIPDGVSLCPQCGAMVEETQPSRTVRSAKPEGKPQNGNAGGPARRLSTVLLWGLGFLLVLVLSVGSGIYFGMRQGEQERIARLEREAEHHYQAGLERLDGGQLEIALAEFEYVLQIDPDHPRAEQGIAEAQARLQAVPTATPTANPEEPITTTVYQEALAHYEAERWQEAAAALVSLRQIDSAYEAEQVEQMLFESLYQAGMGLLEDGDFELGIFYLDRAVALRPLDEAASTQRRLAQQYVEAYSYWGADWERCIAGFEELYLAAPDYRDVFQRLYQAHLAYAEASEAQGEMCPAVEQYAGALQLLTSAEVEDKRAEAAEICARATPTPFPTIAGSQPVTMTALPPGFNAGRLAYPLYNPATGAYDVYALFADGRLLRMASSADQPIWIWNSDTLAYRDRLSPGISLLPSFGAAPQQVASGSGLAWPTFSPDGRRMAYAASGASGAWEITIAPTDGSAAPSPHAPGKGPAWGPTGLLAWTGCETGSSDACGIFIDNPDDGQPPTRVSGSINDVALSWSPGGNKLAYMSNHTGNWDIYTYDVGGGFQVLTDDPASDGLPAWSPDGSAIAFVSDRNGDWGIYLMQPGGEDPRKVISLGDTLPNWTSQRLSWAP
jgi:tetratricopeptide (TPR) repeat protein